MLKIILTMLVGTGIGFLCRKVGFLSYIGKTISITIYLMLFLLGVSVGNNPDIMGNLSTLGIQAFILAFAGTLGSLVAGWILYIRLFRKDENAELASPGEKSVNNVRSSGKWKRRMKKIAGSLNVVFVFIAGVILGLSGSVGQDTVGENTVLIALYCLMFQVGISLGYDTALKNALKGMKPKVLLVPLATVTGTLAFAALAALFIPKWTVPQCLAASSGFAYYSLSSVLIAEYASESLGVQMAAELGTIALLTNIFREISCLLLTPLYVKVFGKIAPICAAGVTSVDVTLPVIIKNCGREYMPVAIIQGVLVDFSVPFFVSFFCSI